MLRQLVISFPSIYWGTYAQKFPILDGPMKSSKFVGPIDRHDRPNLETFESKRHLQRRRGGGREVEKSRSATTNVRNVSH